MFLNRDTTLSDYYAPTSELPTGSGYQAISAGSDYGLAIEAVDRVAAGAVLCSVRTRSSRSVDSNPPGTAESFQYTAAASASASTFHVFLDASNEARTVIVGVYADVERRARRPAEHGAVQQSDAGEWNAIPVPPMALEAGRKYWLALLGPRGDGVIRFRDLPDPEGGPTRLSAQHHLSAWRGLPTTWCTGADFANSPASLYLD